MSHNTFPQGHYQSCNIFEIPDLFFCPSPQLAVLGSGLGHQNHWFVQKVVAEDGQKVTLGSEHLVIRSDHTHVLAPHTPLRAVMS